jgi:hypothetical protein
MQFLWFILIGIAAGWLAGQVMKGGGYGLVGDQLFALHADVPTLGEQALDPVQKPTVLLAGVRVGPTCGARSM